MIDTIGQKIVFIGGITRAPLPHETFPIVGETYTVRSFEEASTKGEIFPSILLAEITNPPHHYVGGYKEVTFRKDHFRPMVTVKQEYDLSIFTDLLANVKKTIPLDKTVQREYSPCTM